MVTEGLGTACVAGQTHELQAGDVVYVPPGAEHEIRNTGDALLGVLFVNVPTGEGLSRLAAARAGAP